MRTRFMRNALYGSLLLSVFSLYGCSNEMEVQDDGQKPVLNLALPDSEVLKRKIQTDLRYSAQMMLHETASLVRFSI